MVRAPSDRVPGDGTEFRAELLSSLLESSTEHAIICIDMDDKILLWNEGARRLYGLESAGAIGKDASSLLYMPEDVQAGKPRDVLTAALRDGKWEGRLSRPHGNGRHFIDRTVVTVRRDRWMRPVGFMMISQGVARETPEGRESVGGREHAEIVRGGFECSSIPTVLTDLQNQFIRPNAAFGQLFGYDADEMVGMTLASVTHPDDLSESFARRDDLLAGRAACIQMEKRYRHRDGHIFWGLTNVALVRDSDGSPVRYVGQIQDINERKRAEEALRYAEARFRALVEQSIAGFYIFQSDRFTYVNPRMSEILGFGCDELTARPLLDFIADDERQSVQAKIEDRFAMRVQSVRYQTRMRHREGHTIDVEVHGSLVENGGGPMIVGILIDVTERRASERRNLAQNDELKRRLERLRALREIDKAITGAFELPLVLSVVLDQVLGRLAIDSAAVLLYNPHLPALEYVASRGYQDELPACEPQRLDDGPAGRAVIERRTQAVSNIADVFPPLACEGFSSYWAVPLIAHGRVLGVLEVAHRTPLSPNSGWLEFLEALAGQTAIAIHTNELFEGLRRSNLELTMAYDATIEGWARALDLRDHETEGHARRVTEMTVRLARALAIPDTELVHVRRGALLHDIGKMGIPDSILLKPGPLTEAERVVIQEHPTLALKFMSPFSFLRPALDIPYCHHERWDGTGYPRRLSGEQIPLSARIFAVVDIWDALMHDRPYRKAWPRERVVAHVQELAGSHLDPKVVSLFLKLISRSAGE